MAPELLDLPLELLELIFEQALDGAIETRSSNNDNFYWESGLFNLSSTCSFLRTLLAPKLFDDVIFTNDRRSAESALLTVKKYSRHVKAISFTGRAKKHNEVSPCFRCRGRQGRLLPLTGDEDEILCSAARELLRGTHTPEAKVLSLYWGFDYADPDSEFWAVNDGNPRYTFFGEDDDEMVEEERRYPWRALMKAVWANVAQNEVIRSLTFSGIPLVYTSTFDSKPFKTMMGRLDIFNLVFKQNRFSNIPHGAMAGFVPFISDLEPKVMQHITNISQLGFMAPRDGLIGLEVPVPGLQLEFPKLTTLSLTNLCLSVDYLDFFTKHQRTLKSLVFLRCWTVRFLDDGLEWEANWCDIFDSLQQQGSILDEFYCVPSIFNFADSIKTETDSNVTDDEIKMWEEVAEILQQNPEKRNFDYAALDEDTGAVYTDASGVLQSLKSGADQRSFDSLMKLVEQNKALRKAERKPLSQTERHLNVHEPLMLQALFGPD